MSRQEVKTNSFMTKQQPLYSRTHSPLQNLLQWTHNTDAMLTASLPTNLTAFVGLFTHTQTVEYTGMYPAALLYNKCKFRVLKGRLLINL
jgi:hypothetical protein